MRASPDCKFSRLRHLSRTEGVNALLLSTAIDLETDHLQCLALPLVGPFVDE
jgi:hypothetical protein